MIKSTRVMSFIGEDERQRVHEGMNTNSSDQNHEQDACQWVLKNQTEREIVPEMIEEKFTRKHDSIA